MTDKQYKCLNGDLIEVGKEYQWGKSSKVEVLKILKDNQVISWCEVGDVVEIDDIEDYDSLWQEQPDKDGWIPHTTGKQPVADGVVVELKLKSGYEVQSWKAKHWDMLDDCADITHYRIVEDKQEPEELCLKDIEKRLTELEEYIKIKSTPELIKWAYSGDK